MGPSSFRLNQYGCFPAGVALHSKKPSAGTRHRLDRYASRNNGLPSTPSERALITNLDPSCCPPRILIPQCIQAATAPSTPPAEPSCTTTTLLVGAMLYRGAYTGTSTRPNLRANTSPEENNENLPHIKKATPIMAKNRSHRHPNHRHNTRCPASHATVTI